MTVLLVLASSATLALALNRVPIREGILVKKPAVE
jgi:hypothetical protein